MLQKNKITILSTFAEDKLFNENGQLIRKQKGGPAFYILKTFKDEGVSFNLIVGPEMKVEILIKGGEEFGRIKKDQNLKR